MKRAGFPSDISLTTVSNLKMWLQSFSELLFSLQQSSKNLVSFDFSPLAGKWHIWGQGIKVWSLGRRGQGYCFRARKQLQVQKMCTRKGRSGRGPFKMCPFKFNKSLCSPLCELCASLPRSNAHPSLQCGLQKGIFMFVVKFSVIT